MSFEEIHNQRAWDRLVQKGDPFTIPVEPQVIASTRAGQWQVFLSPTRPVPRAWFGDLPGKDILCLAAGGGQQAPILATLGARVTVLDISSRQLSQDRLVAKRENLEIQTVLGSMSDLSMFADQCFDLIVNPVSNLYIPNLWPVWVECHRLLRPGGSLLAGFMNPAFYIFDRRKMDDEDKLLVRNSIPYSDLDSLTHQELQEMQEKGWPVEFGHSLEDQIGVQISVGFSIAGFYEDRDPRNILSDYMPIYIITRAVKQEQNQ
jgi:SAM-dependent methyltransferase